MKLKKAAQQIRFTIQTSPEHQANLIPPVIKILQLDYVRYNIEKGGIGQLFYNTEDEFLDSYRSVILESKADKLLNFYDKALDIKKKKNEHYLIFKKQDYIEESEIKNEFLLLSLQNQNDINIECQNFIDNNLNEIENWRTIRST